MSIVKLYLITHANKPMYILRHLQRQIQELLAHNSLSQTMYSSSSIFKRFIPKTKLNIGKYAFSVAAGTILNKLPVTIKSSETIVTFRRNKPYLFENAYPP